MHNRKFLTFGANQYRFWEIVLTFGAWLLPTLRNLTLAPRLCTWWQQCSKSVGSRSLGDRQCYWLDYNGLWPGHVFQRIYVTSVVPVQGLKWYLWEKSYLRYIQPAASLCLRFTYRGCHSLRWSCMESFGNGYYLAYLEKCLQRHRFTGRSFIPWPDQSQPLCVLALSWLWSGLRIVWINILSLLNGPYIII